MPVKVLDVDVRQAGRINGLAGYSAVDVLFRSGPDPVARVQIRCEGDSLDLAALASGLHARAQPRPTLPVGPAPRISVAICTRDRPEDLAVALASLQQQTLEPLELLVVDNGSRPGAREVVDRVASQARVLREERPGLDFARNRALAEARGDVIAFTDDDVEVDRGWLRALCDAFASHPEAGAVTGLVLPLELDTDAQWLFERNGGYARGLLPRVLPRDGRRMLGLRLPAVSEVLTVGNGCNMALRADALRALGGFDESLDTGPPLPGGGDLDVLYRLIRAGRAVVYEPRAIVRHRHRRSHAALSAQLTGYRRALAAFLVKTIGYEGGRARIEAAAFLAWRSVKDVLRLLGGLARRDVLPLWMLGRILAAGFVGLGSYPASRRRLRAADPASALGATPRSGGGPESEAGSSTEAP